MPCFNSAPSAAFRARWPRVRAPWAGAAIVLALILTGCANPLPENATVSEQIAASACYNDCFANRQTCDEHARFDYRQCQAGYTSAFGDYRGCLASSLERDDCGFVWWPCAENLYGACANRHRDCQAVCRATYAPPESRVLAPRMVGTP